MTRERVILQDDLGFIGQRIITCTHVSCFTTDVNFGSTVKGEQSLGRLGLSRVLGAQLFVSMKKLDKMTDTVEFNGFSRFPVDDDRAFSTAGGRSGVNDGQRFKI